MAIVRQRQDIFTNPQVDKGTVYGKPYMLSNDIRIEVGKHTIHLKLEESQALIQQLVAANVRLIKERITS